MAKKLIINGDAVLGGSDSASSILCKDINGNDSTLAIELNRINNLLNNIYPIGSIYISIDETAPNLIFGGVWEKIKDTFLLASGENYLNGEVGGEVEHTLTTNELPSHNHKHRQYIFNGGSSNGTKYGFTYSSNKGSTYDNTEARAVDYGQVIFGNFATGGSQPHNNMPPYLAVNMWKRVG